MNQINCVFFDVKETLSQRIGIITNLPSTVSAEKWREMLQNAGLMEWVDPELIIINHEAQHDKPEPDIYQYAAQKAGVPVERCTFIGENLLEVIEAQNAGMQAIVKPFPPGREFKLQPQRAGPGNNLDSGRLAEIVMEEDHLIGKRIVVATSKIVEKMKAGTIPFKAMSLLVYLTNHFVDKYHHKKEEEVLFPLAIAAGVKPEVMELALKGHDQDRIYFQGMDTALQRYQMGYEPALEDFRMCATGFIEHYKLHGKMKVDIVLPAIGKYLTDLDDAIVIDLFEKIGPADLSPYLLLISNLEKEANK